VGSHAHAYPRRSVERVQLDLQAAIALPFEYARGEAAPWLILPVGVLPVGGPFRRAEEEIAVAMRLNKLKLMTRRSHSEDAAEEFLYASRPFDDVMGGRKKDGIVGV
jgi:hypothetical protein